MVWSELCYLGRCMLLACCLCAGVRLCSGDSCSAFRTTGNVFSVSTQCYCYYCIVAKHLANFFVSQSISCSLRLLSVLPVGKITFRALCFLRFLFPFFSADPVWVLGVSIFMNCSKVSGKGSKIVAGGGDYQMILKQTRAEWNHHHHFW
jgi:hypothetical protein